ncbi:stage V sporulation protein D [Clostridium putrefaciens]|uniref:Stage V sporulation protein D n=1 Tax=Clostridium putrefaciens TaxID=99675 RepID=A0A381J7J6_9CLOT|nr:stage V sporulation protein D [Clostridium putrefaciens]SUY47230.1 stage V sporulation protein D [Clostridium putrefaciens]
MSKIQYNDQVIIRKRIVTIFIFFVISLTILITRLFYIMIIKSPDYSARAEEQWTSEVKISAKRGSILDRNGKELAISANVYRADLDMNAFRSFLKKEDLTNEGIAASISEVLEMETKEVLKILDKKLPNGKVMQSANLIRRIEKDEADKLKSLGIGGMIVSPDTKRYYPNNNFLAHVLGTTNIDGDGLTGIELAYNKELTGTFGVSILEIDSRGADKEHTISEYRKPAEGMNIFLTIDEKIQQFAEQAAEQALIDNQAKNVSIIVMNPKTGEVYALANKPDFNPNKPKEENESMDDLQKKWRNKIVNDTYEPGSIFKVITSIGAMEEGLIDDSSKFMCNGSIKVANRTIHCWKRTGHGEQNFQEILKNSCNVGFVNVGQKLQREKLNKYIKAFGFGQKTGIDLPGEAKGIVKKTETISEVDLATISFGQTNTVSPIQFLAAFNTLANNGVWVRPHVMKQIMNIEENNVYKTYEDYGEKRVVSEENTKLLRSYLENVIAQGSGKRAHIEGYHIAGKTGTAQKVNSQSGTYEHGKYVASFVGMAPAHDPEITVFISIDEPSSGEYYAGVIATPVAKQVFNNIFNYLHIKPDSDDKSVEESLLKDIIVPDVRGMKKAEAIKILKSNNLSYEVTGELDSIYDMSPKPGYTIKENKKILLYADKSYNYNKEVIVPSLTGYSKDGALSILNSIGLEATMEGDGMVIEQNLEADTIVKYGTNIHILLSPTGID